jgi:hypothetical protein
VSANRHLSSMPIGRTRRSRGERHQAFSQEQVASHPLDEGREATEGSTPHIHCVHSVRADAYDDAPVAGSVVDANIHPILLADLLGKNEVVVGADSASPRISR